MCSGCFAKISRPALFANVTFARGSTAFLRYFRDFQASGLIINRLQARQPQVVEGPGRPSELQQQVRRGPSADREATKRDLTTFARRDRELDRKVPDIESCLLRELHHIPRHL